MDAEREGQMRHRCEAGARSVNEGVNGVKQDLSLTLKMCVSAGAIAESLLPGKHKPLRASAEGFGETVASILVVRLGADANRSKPGRTAGRSGGSGSRS
jgi:hypothetical protein